MTIAKLLKAKLKETGESPARAASRVGVAPAGFNAVLAGKASPNRRTLAKYARYLGIDETEAMRRAGRSAAPPRAATMPARGRRVAARTGRARPGRALVRA